MENPAQAEPGDGPPTIQVTPTQFDRQTAKLRHLARAGNRVEVVDKWGTVLEVLVRPDRIGDAA